MTAAELVRRIDDAQKIVEFGVRFNADETARRVYRDDQNREETRAILTSFLKHVESYEWRISRNVYRWARDYDGLTFDGEEFEELHLVHPCLFDRFLNAYIKLISKNKRQE